MNADNLDLRLLRFRARRDEYPHALATALLEAGRIPEALEVVQIGLLQSENDTGLLVLEGRAWFEQGDLPQAQAALLRAAKVSPRDKEPYRWLAQVLMKRGEPARAVQVLERALQIDPSDATLQQAHARAQRLSRIASEADHEHDAPRASRPRSSTPKMASSNAPPAQRITERPRSGGPQAKVEVPKPGRALPPPPAQSARAQAAAGRGSRSAAQPAGTPFDAPPDTASPLELSRPLPARRDVDSDDEATVAAELPKELRTWLDAERSSHTPIPTTAHTSNDNARATALAAGRSTDFSGDSEPTLAVHSAELRDAFDAIEAAERGALEAEAHASPAETLTEGEPTHDAEGAAPPAEPEPPEEVLGLLARQGIFEPTQRSREGENWVPKSEAQRTGQRLGRSFAVSWLLALSAAGGAYYGFTVWLEARRGDASALIQKALSEVRDGEYESLLAAERHLTEARSLDPKRAETTEALLFVHAARALEDASGEMGYLRNSLARAKEKNVDKAVLSAAKALLSAYEGDAKAARAEAEVALKLGGDDARVLYLVGRLYQRAGLAEADALLSRATERDPELSLASLARGEIALEQGDPERAKTLFEKARGSDGKELRAELWQIVVEAESQAPAALLTRLDALGPRIEHGSASDKLLAISARAGLLLARGDEKAAREVIQQGDALRGVRAPELTALFAERALALGELDLAYRAARSALQTAPNVRRYRDTLVQILLRRGDGSAALAALAGLDADAGSLLVAKSRAALLEGSREALEEAKAKLSAYRATPAGKDDPDVAALLLRVDVRLGASAESLLPAARALAQRAPKAPSTVIALADLSVAAHQPQLALSTLESARELTATDAEADYIAGRAQRMLGRGEAARTSLEKALALSPSYVDARFALADLLLDSGEAEEAYALYSALERDGAGLLASLGAAEAQLDHGELSAAEGRYERLDAEQKALPGAQVLHARLFLAKGKPQEAAKTLEPLVQEGAPTRTADVLALYGDALFADERVDSAAGAYEAALEIDPAHPDALVGRAMAAVRAEKTAQAGDFIARARAALKERVRPPRVRAALLLTEGKVDILNQSYDAAKDKLARAVALPGVPPEAYFWYAETLARTKTAGASESYAKYLEVAPRGYFAARAKRALSPR